jgi:hypothetical protein
MIGQSPSIDWEGAADAPRGRPETGNEQSKRKGSLPVLERLQGSPEPIRNVSG